MNLPVHDHLAWGLVGLYVGEQDEEIYETAVPVHTTEDHTDLKLVEKKHLTVGSFYELIPPTGDIHRVITTSQEPSISLHLLGNDVGCVATPPLRARNRRSYSLSLWIHEC